MEEFKTPLPSKEWDALATKVRYPNPQIKYTIQPKDVPQEDTERAGRWIVQCVEGRIYLWESNIIELAGLVAKANYQPITVYFTREGKQTKIEQVVEQL